MSFRVTAQMAPATPGGGTAWCRSNASAATVQCQGTLPLVSPPPAAAGLVATSRYVNASDIIGKPHAGFPDPGPNAVLDSTAATRVVSWWGREFLELTVSW